MKRHFWLFTLLLFPSFGWGQEKVEDDFERYAREQEAAFSEYVGHEEKISKPITTPSIASLSAT